MSYTNYLVDSSSLEVKRSELRQGPWSVQRDRGTTWLTPSSTATEIGVFLNRFDATPEQLGEAGWNRVIGTHTLPDGRRLVVAAGNPDLSIDKRVELIALKRTFDAAELAALDNPRLVIVAGDSVMTRHFVEVAAK